MILERATTDEIHEASLRAGMISMRQDGWMKICMGLTTFSEVARQTPKDIPLTGGAQEDDEIDEPAKLPKPAPEALAPPPQAPPKPAADAKQNPMIAEGEAGSRPEA
jgi:hypothetical protein